MVSQKRKKIVRKEARPFLVFFSLYLRGRKGKREVLWLSETGTTLESEPLWIFMNPAFVNFSSILGELCGGAFRT